MWKSIFGFGAWRSPPRPPSPSQVIDLGDIDFSRGDVLILVTPDNMTAAEADALRAQWDELCKRRGRHGVALCIPAKYRAMILRGSGPAPRRSPETEA